MGAALAVAASSALVVDPASALLTPTVKLTVPVSALRLPATIKGDASVTSEESLSGNLVVALYPPAAGSASATKNLCNAEPTATQTVLVNGTTGVASLSRLIPVSGPEGVWGMKARYAGDAAHSPAESACVNVLMLAPDTEWNPNEPANPDWLPFRSPAALVSRQYKDILGRVPTAAEEAAWVEKLLAQTTTRGALVAELRTDPDQAAHVDPMVRLYTAYFLRQPDAAGLRFWTAARRSGRSVLSVSEFFATSPEFVDRYGALSNADFVNLVYRNVLGRDGDQGGVKFWNEQLDKNIRSRGSMMTGFSESPEYIAQQKHPVSVSALFAFMMGRAATPAEFDSFVALLSLGPDAARQFTVADLAEEIMRTAGYANRVKSLG